MQKLHPKAVWLFFVQFIIRGFIVFLFVSLWLLPFFLTFVFKGATITVMNETKYYPPTEPEIERGYLSLTFFLYIVFIIVYVVFCWIWAKLTYRYWKYELAEDAFKKECGVIWKKYVSIPYERIQNVDIYRGVFARILGLSDLQVQTAGYSAISTKRGIVGMNAEGRLLGLDKNTAEQLREELIKRAKEAKQGLGL